MAQHSETSPGQQVAGNGRLILIIPILFFLKKFIYRAFVYFIWSNVYYHVDREKSDQWKKMTLIS